MLQKVSFLNKPFPVWFFANILGFCAIGVLALVSRYTISIPGFVSSALVIAVPISLFQWLALRRILHVSVLWVLTTPVMLLASIVIRRNIPSGMGVNVDDESIVALTFGYLVFGFLVGLPQWLILRQQLSWSSIWLLGSTIGCAAGPWLILVTGLINQSGEISLIVAILVYITITGLVLNALLSLNSRPQTNLVQAA